MYTVEIRPEKREDVDILFVNVSSDTNVELDKLDSAEDDIVAAVEEAFNSVPDSLTVDDKIVKYGDVGYITKTSVLATMRAIVKGHVTMVKTHVLGSVPLKIPVVFHWMEDLS